MNAEMLKTLFALSLRNPREAAELIVGMKLPTQALWLALSLVSVLTSLVFSSLLHAAPMPQDEVGQMIMSSPGYDSPLIFALMQWGRAVLSVFVLYWVGKSMGGLGTLGDVLAVITWLQMVTFTLIAGLFAVGFIFPFVSTIGMLVVLGWWLWAVVSFLDVAHRFGSPFKAFGVLIVSILGVLLGITVIMGVILSLFAGITGGP